MPPTPVQRCIVGVLVAFGAVATVYAFVAYALPLAPGFAALRSPRAGGDSIMTIVSARLAAGGDPTLAYHGPALRETARSIMPSYDDLAAWAYPPTMMVVTRPLGALPPAGALLGWLGLLAAAGAAAGAVATRAPGGAGLGLAAPAMAVTLATGQFSTVGALGIAAFVGFFDRDPRLAGAALGVLALKPQLAVAAGALALLERRWRLIGWAALTQLALGAASIALFGAAMWPAFVAAGRDLAGHMVAGQIAPGRTVSVFLQLIGVGLPPAAAAWIAVPVALAAIAACWRIFRRVGDPALRALALAATTILAVPYAHDYDFVLLLAPGALLVAEAWRRAVPPARLALAMLVWILPLVVLLAWMRGLPQFGAVLAVALLALAAAGAFRGVAGPWTAARA
jgi:hypothetical protein